MSFPIDRNHEREYFEIGHCSAINLLKQGSWGKRMDFSVCTPCAVAVGKYLSGEGYEFDPIDRTVELLEGICPARTDAFFAANMQAGLLRNTLLDALTPVLKKHQEPKIEGVEDMAERVRVCIRALRELLRERAKMSAAAHARLKKRLAWIQDFLTELVPAGAYYLRLLATDNNEAAAD